MSQWRWSRRPKRKLPQRLVVVMVLLVEPDHDVAQRLMASLDRVDTVRRCTTFHEARQQLEPSPPDLLVSNLRLHEYNGLQLVYLAAFAKTPTRAVVYTITLDVVLARDVQHAGAFYDTADCLEVSLRTYLGTPLPPSDRRDPQRRVRLEGSAGRRLTDLASPSEV